MNEKKWSEWIKRWLANQPLRDHVPAKPPQAGLGTVVKDRASGRVVYREYDEVGNISPKKTARISLRKHTKLARRFNEYHFDIQCGSYNSLEAFDHFNPY